MGDPVRAKKHLGQHFLKDENIALRIAEALQLEGYSQVLEIGPGTGVLTQFLLNRKDMDFKAIDLDEESIDYLHKTYPSKANRFVFGDFLKQPLDDFFEGEVGIIGNFPYNISSQILFKAYENRHRVPELVGMFQKEVAERVASPPGSKAYGILSVLLQAFYDIEYLFTVNEHVFSPPPKVKSGVIRLKRNGVTSLNCDEKRFTVVVKTAFNQRRKTLRNSLKSLVPDKEVFSDELFNKRPEQLAVEDFVNITRLIEASQSK
jgi:16S rRNA (adenine1518-N6/adenine1519-N6)-dimethyltransferase